MDLKYGYSPIHSEFESPEKETQGLRGNANWNEEYYPRARGL